MFASIPSSIVVGVDGRPVTVEVHVSTGVPGLSIVGLPDAACREARDRVRAAVMGAGISWPLKRITVNLAPSDLRKPGSALDVAIAVGVLVAEGELDAEAARDLAFLGELGLDGTVRSVTGIVPLVDAVRAPTVVVPAAKVHEAELVAGPEVRGVSTLRELVAALRAEEPWPDPPPALAPPPLVGAPDLAEVRGQPVVRRALEVAAAGGHHLLMVGPPGAGKTMLASRLPGLLPDLGRDEAMEVTRIHSAAGVALERGMVVRPPYRAPHHGATLVGLVGGGSDVLRPGELSQAHGGVLFLDELAEFSPVVLDSLRQPLEAGIIRISRARFQADLPARVLLVAAMNPCPCGEAGRPGRCRCSPSGLVRYRRRLSGPLLDRFDLRVEVLRPEVDELLGTERGESSAAVADRVARARERAAERGVRVNADLGAEQLDEFAPVDDDSGASCWRPRCAPVGSSARGLHPRPSGSPARWATSPATRAGCRRARSRPRSSSAPSWPSSRGWRREPGRPNRRVRGAGRPRRRRARGGLPPRDVAGRGGGGQDAVGLPPGRRLVGGLAGVGRRRDRAVRTARRHPATAGVGRRGPVRPVRAPGRRAGAVPGGRVRGAGARSTGLSGPPGRRPGTAGGPVLDRDVPRTRRAHGRGGGDPQRDVARAHVRPKARGRAGRAGVRVVSGLALGIDGSAHRGALDELGRFERLRAAGENEAEPEPGRPVGVIASGLDIAYPYRQRVLHDEVRTAGLLVSETPLGLRPSEWRFPARNRIIAGLSDAVVVVESRVVGGSMSTVDEALTRSVPVFAVPGHPSSPAAAGTNDLLFAGAAITRSADDVLGAIGRPLVGERRRAPVAPEVTGSQQRVLDELGAGPLALAELVAATGGSVDDVSSALAALEAVGLVVSTGGWYEATATPGSGDR